jgi:hypothetical protein
MVRLGIDVASVDMRHVKLDDEGRYLQDMPSGLNDCLTVEANIDQGARAFRQDVALTMFDKGVAAIVPVDTTTDPSTPGSWDVQSLRVGEVIAWFPRHVTVRLYDDNSGLKKDITLEKKFVAIVENPLYSVMNEPNSTLQRLIRKLNLLDAIDEQSASGKLDLIIQLPYVIKTETRRAEAEKRRKEIEVQLKGSQYGIAYADGTEKITQLNRPAENNLMGQIEYLTTMLYGQLGLTEEVLNGTANEAAMVNYYNQTLEPVLTAIKEAMHRTFLTKTARTQGQAVQFFNNPFKLITMTALAELADKLTRNEILSSNEMRGLIGFKPSTDPKANQLLNKNLPAAYGELPQPGEQVSANGLLPRSPFQPAQNGASPSSQPAPTAPTDGQPAATSAQASDIMSSAFDQIHSAIQDTFKSLGTGGDEEDNTAKS